MVAKKKTSKKVVKKASKKISGSKKSIQTKNKNTELKKPEKNNKGIGTVNPNSKFYHQKLDLVIKNLFLFGVLFVLSVILLSVSTNELYQNLFMLLGMLFAFLTLAFLIILLIFIFVRLIKKK